MLAGGPTTPGLPRSRSFFSVHASLRSSIAFKRLLCAFGPLPHRLPPRTRGKQHRPFRRLAPTHPHACSSPVFTFLMCQVPPVACKETPSLLVLICGRIDRRRRKASDEPRPLSSPPPPPAPLARLPALHPLALERILHQPGPARAVRGEDLAKGSSSNLRLLTSLPFPSGGHR